MAERRAELGSRVVRPALPRLWFNRSSCCGEIAMGAVSYLLFLGAMLGLALGLYFGLRTAKLI